MKQLFISLFLLSTFSFLYAAEGDTTVIRSHDKQLMKFPPANRDYINKVKFPDGSVTYRKIILAYELGCPSTGCSTWDYDTHVSVIQPTGQMDSTLHQQAFFEVDGLAPDSFYISLTPTYQTYFDSVANITDSIMSDTVFVEEYRNASSPTTVTNSFNAFETGYYKYYFNPNGVRIDSIYEDGDSLWYNGNHTWYTLFEIKNTIELGRLITPYGETSGMKYYPYTTFFDITDYASLLVDSMDIKLRFSGWQNGFLATLDFIFVEGTPPRDPERVVALHNGSYAYGSATNPINTRLAPYDLQLTSSEQYAQLNYTVTGHGADNSGCSEFCARSYFVKVDGSTKITKIVWKDDCGYNPLNPQGGTWIYDRANWCPGLPGYTDRHELTSFLNSSGPSTIKIDFQNHIAAGGSPSYSIDGAIITYGPANFALDASVEEILAPNNYIIHGRYNPICDEPKIRITNTGSTTLTSLKITYGAKGGAMSVYNWSGSLEFLESEEVELNRPNWARTHNVFEVTISDPNGGTDGYAGNNFLSAPFEVPDVLPNSFRIFYRTNDRSSSENALWIEDENENVVYSRFGVKNNTSYEDSVGLPDGCYTLTLTDAGKDGLAFWAGSQTNGSLRIHKTENMGTHKIFNSDFGTQIDYQFMVGSPLAIDENNEIENYINVYPNPSTGTIYIDGIYIDGEPAISLYDQVGRSVKISAQKDGNGRWVIEAGEHSKGLYTIRVISGSEIKVVKVLLK